MSYITVFTPTYNRENLLRRPFESLLKQTFLDFEWLIIDDGSKDNTEDLVKQFMKEAPFSIKYIKKENGGRASALNESYKYIKTKYVINLDSDDELVPDALQKMHDVWESIPPEEYNRFWCITGHCISSINGKIIGGEWPENINSLKGKKQHKEIVKNKKGEKSCCRKTEILKRFPFPQYDDTRFVPENIVWEKINKQYDQFCTNEVFRVYYENSPDSLSKGGSLGTEYYNSIYHAYIFYINELFDQFIYNREVRWSLYVVPRSAIRTKRSFLRMISDVNAWYKRVIISLLWGPIWIFSKIKK